MDSEKWDYSDNEDPRFYKLNGIQEWRNATPAKQQKMEAAAADDVRWVLLDTVSGAPLARMMIQGLVARGHAAPVATHAVGNLLTPPDGTAFVPISTLQVGHFKSLKKIKAVLNKHDEIRTHLTSPRRRVVHAGDWALFIHEQAPSSDSEVAKYRGAIDRRQAQSGQWGE